MTLALRNVDDDLARRLKVAAYTHGLTLREYILELIERAVVDIKPVPARKARTDAK